jgi:hypothetical protein
MFNILFAMCLATLTLSIHSMEITKKSNNDNKQKRDRVNSSNSFLRSSIFTTVSNEKLVKKTKSNSNLTQTITPPEAEQEHPFIVAVKDSNQTLIKNYLGYDYFDPNIYYNGSGTAFHACIHICIFRKDFSLLKIFLEEPRIDTTIKNKTLQQTGHDVLKQRRLQEKNQALKETMYIEQQKLFAQLTLDMTTNDVCSTLQPSYQRGLVTDAIITNAINDITSTIRRIENSQEEELPLLCRFPSYAKFGYMKTKILFVLARMDKAQSKITI